jgi:hypothetical protein
MANRDLVHNLKPTIMLAPVVRTSTVLSAAADLQGHQSAMVAFDIGAFGDAASATVFFEAELQECDTSGGSYTAVADTDLLFPGVLAARVGTVAASGVFFQSKTTAAADLTGLYTVGYRGSKRFLKVNVRVTGTNSTGTPVAVTAYADNSDYKPAQ